jgi:hypothetical protein
MSHRVRFAGAMHPSRAVRFPYQPAPRRQPVRGVLLAFVIGTALAAVSFIGLSGGFRP